MSTASRAIGLLLLCCAGCKHEPLAVLIETQGAVERDFERAQTHYSPAKAGARFDEGDGLRTLVGATALLRVGARGQARVEGETTIRFRSARPGSKQRFSVEVVAGAATLLSGTEALSVRTKSGEAILVAGSALRVRQSDHGQRYEVVFGRASLPTHDGKRVDLGKGQVFEVEIGLAQMAATSNAKATPPKVEPEVVKLDAVVMQPAAEAAPSVDGADGADNGLDYADVVLRAGTSATIYDPKPPTAVGLDVAASCPKGAVVRAGSGKRSRSARGYGQVNLALPAGAHTYHVSCLGQDNTRAISGMVFVLHKSGADSLPRSAPTNSIDLDGRRYTVMFQNLPPVIHADWPKAPKADHYVLHGTLASGKALALTTHEPSYRFGPGEIPEGENHLYFEAASKDTPRSRETTVVVKFDNAAPTASLRLPAVDGFVRAPSVEVEGVALPSSTVSVNGQSLALDAQHRFTGSIPLAEGARALSVRIDHPRIGIRYYIRRPQGAP